MVLGTQNPQGCLTLTSSISNKRVPRVEPSPLARRVGLKMVVNNLCLSKNWEKIRAMLSNNVTKLGINESI